MAILTATAQQFIDRGWDRLSIEGIAQAAGVGKQTIYRWWPSKGALVSECLLEGYLVKERFLLPETGNLRRDLAEWLVGIEEVLANPEFGELFRSLVGAAAEQETIGHLLGVALGADSVVTARLEAGERAGEMPEGLSVAELKQIIIGGLALPLLTREPIEPGRGARIVAALLPER